MVSNKSKVLQDITGIAEKQETVSCSPTSPTSAMGLSRKFSRQGTQGDLFSGKKYQDGKKLQETLDNHVKIRNNLEKKIQELEEELKEKNRFMN